MRKFYLILINPNIKNSMMIESFDKKDIDITLFWEAKFIDKSILSNFSMNFKMYINQKKTIIPDLLDNPFSIMILSEKFLGYIKNLINKDVQILNINLIDKKTNYINTNFYLIHPYRDYLCLDIEKSDIHKYENNIIIGENIYIIGENIPKDCHIFRLKENNHYIIVSEEIIDTIRGKKLTGFSLIPCENSTY